MNFGLGTVQFGIDYGIANKTGPPALPEIDRILSLAYDSGLRMLDTAPGYGDSEEILGKLIKHFPKYRVVTKTCRLEGEIPAKKVLPILRESLQDSLRKLCLERVDVLLLHQPELLKSQGPEIVEALLELKRSGLARAVGISVYTAQDIDCARSLFKPDMIQLPINLFDQRLLRSGHLAKLRMEKVEIVARSIFLQGLLLMEGASRPVSMKRWEKQFEEYDRHLSSHKLGRLAACIAFIMNLDVVDTAIVGVCSTSELQGILEAVNTATMMKVDFSALAVDDENLVNPARWGKS